MNHFPGMRAERDRADEEKIAGILRAAQALLNERATNRIQMLFG